MLQVFFEAVVHLVQKGSMKAKARASKDASKKEAAKENVIQPLAAHFVEAGEMNPRKPKSAPAPAAKGKSPGFEATSDWEVSFDLAYTPEHRKVKQLFPQSILQTNQAPDGVIWSWAAKIIFILELTVPWEEGVAAAHKRKEVKYTRLEADLISRGWKVFRYSFEIGCRGTICDSTLTMMRELGFPKKLADEVSNSMAMTACLCSYVVFQYHNEPAWPAQPLMIKYRLPLSDVHLPTATVE